MTTSDPSNPERHENVSCETSVILEAAAELLEPDGAWTQGLAARDVEGNPQLPVSKAATCWCVLGALERVAGEETSDFYAARKVFKAMTCPEVVVSRWNDAPERTQAEVVQALRDAAKAVSS